MTTHDQAGDGTIYTCPMHSTVRQIAPGNCPICGMALEPLQSAPSDAPSPELLDLTRRLWIGGALSAPLFVLEMGGHFPGLNLQHLVPPLLSQWIQFLLATPVVLWAGWPFFTRGWDSIRLRSLNMFSLIALGVGAAYLYSLAATFLPGLFPAGLRNSHGLIPVYYEAAAVITVLVLIGQVLELRAREHTIRALLNLAPKTARRLRASADDEEITLDQVIVGDRLRVRPGEAIPVDGAVLAGSSAIDESMVTGESMPVEKSLDSAVIGGTINGVGSLIMRADKVGADTMLARIVHMVRSRSHRHRHAVVHRLARMGSPARARLRAGRSRFGSHHCLPLRAGSRNTHVHHGWHWQGRERRDTHQERGSARALREGRHAGRRQDRHAHRGEAPGHCRQGNSGVRRGDDPVDRSEPRACERTSAVRVSGAPSRDSPFPLATAGSWPTREWTRALWNRKRTGCDVMARQ
jgi:E1-E2 ATPase/Heavy metal binding domain